MRHPLFRTYPPTRCALVGYVIPIACDNPRAGLCNSVPRGFRGRNCTWGIGNPIARALQFIPPHPSHPPQEGRGRGL